MWISVRLLAGAVAEALRRRGTEDPAATLTAETGITLFRVAFERWANGAAPRSVLRRVRGS